MSKWYILPNGNIKHVNGLELQPEQDWFPTEDSMEAFAEALRAQGHSEALIIKRMMALSLDCEKWVQDNLR